jgi:hypothetical protein
MLQLNLFQDNLSKSYGGSDCTTCPSLMEVQTAALIIIQLCSYQEVRVGIPLTSLTRPHFLCLSKARNSISNVIWCGLFFVWIKVRGNCSFYYFRLILLFKVCFVGGAAYRWMEFCLKNNQLRIYRKNNYCKPTVHIPVWSEWLRCFLFSVFTLVSKIN